MVRLTFCFAAAAVGLQPAAPSTAQAAAEAAAPAQSRPSDEARPAPIDPARLFQRTLVVGNRTILVDQVSGR